MPSPAYLDLGGLVDRPRWPSTYSVDVIQRPCLRCSAAPFHVCLNPATGRPAKLPCLARI